MAPMLTILASATLAISIQLQAYEKAKPAVKPSAPTEKPKAEKKKERIAKTDSDVDFRAQGVRTRVAISTECGKLVPPGKKPGEGC